MASGHLVHHHRCPSLAIPERRKLPLAWRPLVCSFYPATHLVLMFSLYLQTCRAISSLGFTEAQLYSKNLGRQRPMHSDQPSQLLSVRSQECKMRNGPRAPCPSLSSPSSASPIASCLPLSWVCYPELGGRREGGSRELFTTQRALCLACSSSQASISTHTHPTSAPQGTQPSSPALSETTAFLLPSPESTHDQGPKNLELLKGHSGDALSMKR